MNNKSSRRFVLFHLLLLSSSSVAAKDMMVGESLDIPYSVVYPSQKRETGNWSPYYNSPDTKPTAGAIVTSQSTGLLSCYSYNSNEYGWSSDNKIFGFKFDEDIILGVQGNSSTDKIVLSDNSQKYSYGPGGWASTFSSDQLTYTGKMVTSGNKRPFCGALNTGGRALFYMDEIRGAAQSGTLRLYIGPKATTGKKTISAIYAQVAPQTGEYNVEIMGAMEINVIVPRTCTVSTDNTITFLPVDITDAVNGKALANKTGNFTVTCDDTTNAPVTVEIQGSKGRYTDAMKLTMTDGTNAPAEVRGFLGSDIPLGGECNGRLNGHNGVVYFVPNAGLEKISLKPGSYKYNWVLCSKSKDEYKTGEATGSAKMIVNWD